MSTTKISFLGPAARLAGTAACVAAAGYGAYVGMAWLRYGYAAPPRPDERDDLLDRFMPAYEIVERHHIRVAAPRELTLAAARDMDLQASPIVRAIIRTREVLLGATPDRRPQPRGLLDQMRALGWGVLADVPGRELIAGAVTKPWEPNVTFRALPPEAFAAFAEPDYVKIAWTLRVRELNASGTLFQTETRAVATDPGSRAKFRRYWAFLSPGIILIRLAVLRPLKREAERRARLLPS